VTSVSEALGAADLVILAIPGSAVGELTATHQQALTGKLVIDATNKMGESVANSRAALPRRSVTRWRSTPRAARTWLTRSSMTARPTCSSPVQR